MSNTIYKIKKTRPQQDLKINQAENSQAYYEKGMSFHKMHEYLSAEEAFLKAILIADKSKEKEILSFSFHYLGNIESWKSNFTQSIFYNKKARNLFQDLKNSEYEAISN